MMRNVLIGIILLGIGLAGGWFLRPHVTGSTTNDTTLVYDTAVYEIIDTIPYPVPVPVQIVENITHEFYDTLTIYDTIPIPIDTAGIIADYYRLRIYNDIIADDNLEFHLWEQVGANRVLKRSTSYRILRPDKIVTRYPQSVYIGAMIYDTGLAPMVTFTDQKYYLSAGFDPFNFTWFVGGGVKLWQSK